MLPDDECKLVDGFAIFVQTLMATVALASLLYKRSLERPRRIWMVWILDTSKQAISAVLVHFVNIFLSYLSSVLPHSGSPNPCVWYFLNLLLDTTVGVYILYLFLKLFHNLALSLGVSDIKMGFYGNPPQFLPWFKQLVIFILSWVGVKSLIVVVLTLVPAFGDLTKWFFRIFNGNTKAQVIFVMFIFPLIMNIIQAWLVDKVIKADPQYQIVESDGDYVAVVDESALDDDASDGS